MIEVKGSMRGHENGKSKRNDKFVCVHPAKANV
jgi:hypothetical protein